jgi:glycosyltransferase involved in cell wall biosynthesis
MKISGIVITKNEEKNIESAINSLNSVCEEVIVVDSGSTDKTTELSEKSGAKVVFNKWEGYKEQRNFAHNIAKNNWILVLDADETFSKKAIKEITKLKHQKTDNFVAYSFPRNLIFMGVKFGNNLITCERKLRLYNKKYCVWGGGLVHEKLQVKGNIKKLKGFINHTTKDNTDEFNKKLIKYATLEARTKLNKGEKANLFTIMAIGIINFLKHYILKLRFVHGAKGFILAWLYTNYAVLKYIKLYELQNKKKEKKL